MAACTPGDISVSPPQNPPIPPIGSIIPSSPILPSNPEVKLPTNIVEDIVELVNKLSATLPGSVLKPNSDGAMKDIGDFIANLFNQFAPFLSFYNLAMAAFNMIKCVIEVLCAIPNPFAIALKLKKLFTECLPPFLGLFPASALPIMIISLLLLILALVEYILTTILGIIEDLIKNVQALSNAISLNDPEASEAAIAKIAALLCIIQNVLAILIAIQAFITIIETLSKLASGTICSDDDPNGCCPPELCPSFIKTTPNGIEVTSGKLIYTSKIGVDVENILSLPPEIASIFILPPVREERWQIFDVALNSAFAINSIITPIQGNIFWPDPNSFGSDLALKKAPYTADLTITLDPNDFGIIDSLKSREFIIKDCIVVRKPYAGTLTYNNSISIAEGIFGTLNIEGGLVFEKDETTPYIINSNQATLNSFIHLPDTISSSLPGSDDSLEFDIQFIWKPNAGALAGYQLTTVGCMPEINIEKATQNAIIVAQGIEPIEDKIPVTQAGIKVPSSGTFLPNVSGTLNCTNSAMETFRKNVSIENAAIFQATITTCLNDLSNQTLQTVCALLISSVSVFKSTITLNTALEFTSRSIEIKVQLKDANGANLEIGIPQSCADQMAAKLSAETTFGSVGIFAWDKNSAFIGQLNSNNAGKGNLTILFDGKVLSQLIPGIVGGDPSKIEEIMLPYEFIDAGLDIPVRRDEKDLK